MHQNENEKIVSEKETDKQQQSEFEKTKLLKLQAENNRLKSELHRANLAQFRVTKLAEAGISGALAKLISGNSKEEIEHQIELAKQIEVNTYVSAPLLSKSLHSDSISLKEREIAKRLGISSKAYSKQKR